LSIDSQEGRGSTFTCHFPPDRLQAADNADFVPVATTAAAAS
jgi:hypothetical protein